MEKLNYDKLKTQFGLYALENEILVDSNKNSNKHIEAHETVHLLLSTGTTYGLFLVMLKKALVMNKDKEWVKEEFVDGMKKMQECIATAIQYLSVLKNEGIESYNRLYGRLKVNNREYYNYLKDVLWIMDIATIETVDFYIKLLMQLGIFSLQINIDKIPKEVFNSKKEMKKFNNKLENNLLYNPNIRFKKMVKYLQKYLMNEDAEKYNENFVTIIENMSDQNKICEIVKSTIVRVFENSSMLEKIKDRIANFRTKEVDESYYNDYNFSLATFPVSLDENRKDNYEMRNIDLTNFKKIIKNKSKAILHIINRITGLENFHIFAYCDYIKKEVTMSQIESQVDIIEVIKLSNIPIVFDEKKRFIDYKDIMDNMYINKPIYIFMESALHYNIDFVKEYFEGSIYTIIKIDNYYCLCIKDGIYIILQLLSPNALELIKRVIEDSSLNLKFMEIAVSGIYNLKNEIYEIVKSNIEFINYSLRIKGDL